MFNKEIESALTKNSKRRVYDNLQSASNIEDTEKLLGPLKQLPGNWKSLPGRGWNMIALPFATNPDSPINYRLLLNQYDESLNFSQIDGPVPNRGISLPPSETSVDTDQKLMALDYVQTINQIAVDDFPRSSDETRGAICAPIHHEPGLWLHIINENTAEIDIARLGTVPHGDSLLALGTSDEVNGKPTIPDISGLPIGGPTDLSHAYLAPYSHFNINPFENLFDPVNPNSLLQAALQTMPVARSTILHVDTSLQDAGIVNIPFIVKQANATEMKFTMWIHELEETDDKGKPILVMQYSQVVSLDFFERKDGQPGLIKWPHVSINTLVHTDQQNPVHQCDNQPLE